MSELASHVVDLFEAGRVEDDCFRVRRAAGRRRFRWERHAAMAGFLETVQNVASHRKCGSTAFERFLGPNSQRAWAELNRVSLGKKSLAEVVASETGATLRLR